MMTIPKNQNSIRLENNILNGMIAEYLAINDFTNNGFIIKRTGIGSDFIASKMDSSGKIYEMYVEVKFNKSELSKKQKQKRIILRKKGKDYFVYRVTQKFLNNFKIKNPDKVEQIKKHSASRRIIYQNTGIFYSSSKFKIMLPWVCPHCKMIHANNMPELLKNFGLRKMKNNTIRNQSWCRVCRCASKP